MRVIEHALKHFKDKIDIVKFTPNWDATLKAIKTKTDSIEDREEMIKYERICERFLSVKTVWRNPSMHIERSYNQEQAREVFDAMKAFIHSLAVELS